MFESAAAQGGAQVAAAGNGGNAGGWTAGQRSPAPLVRRALVLAQDERLRRLACQLLTATGFEVATADDGLYALMLAQREPLDLIVVAGRSGGLTADSVVRGLRHDARTAQVPVVELGADCPHWPGTEQ